MCVGLAVLRSELPTELIGRHHLERRLHTNGGAEEIRFLLRDRDPRLAIWRHGQVQIARWGNTRRQSQRLPRGGRVWNAYAEGSVWAQAERVEVLGHLGWDNGVWYKIKRGLWGLLVPDENDWAVCYLPLLPASIYYRNMTGQDRMPDFIAQDFGRAAEMPVNRERS